LTTRSATSTPNFSTVFISSILTRKATLERGED
jgi:hypothetical protein